MTKLDKIITKNVKIRTPLFGRYKNTNLYELGGSQQAVLLGAPAAEHHRATRAPIWIPTMPTVITPLVFIKLIKVQI